jgi:hypothetical protein
MEYERNGRLVDAEAAFAKAAVEGSQQTRRAALKALQQVILARESSGPWQQLRLGEMYEQEGRWSDAQAAYKSALETGPSALQAVAHQRLRSIAQHQEGIWERYIQPVLAAAGTVFVSIIGAILLYVVIGPPVAQYGRRRGRHRLAVAPFVPPSGAEPIIGSNMPDVLAAMYERVQTHFRPRIGLGDPKLPALVHSQSSAELIELIGGFNTSAVPLLSWFTRKLNQPAYTISGSIASTQAQIHVLAKLEHDGRTIGHWNRTVHVWDWFRSEQDLAYEILLTLKEYIDDHAS